jgi:hypothetical protein
MNTLTWNASFLILLLLGSLCGLVARADVIIYVSDSPPTGPQIPSLNHDPDAIGTSDFFDVFVKTDVQVFGLSLDVIVEGSNIRLTDIEIPNYDVPGSDHDRWAAVTDGMAALDGKSIRGADGVALPAFAGIGINPAAPDSGFHAGGQAFHLARVHYDIVDVGLSDVFLEIGQNEIGLGAPTDIYLGAGDPPVAVDSDGGGTAGLRSSLRDARIFDIPEPSSIAPLATLVLAAPFRARNRN